VYNNVRLNTTTLPQETGSTSQGQQIQPQNRSPSPSQVQEGLATRTSADVNGSPRPRQPLPSPTGRTSPTTTPRATPETTASSLPQPVAHTQATTTVSQPASAAQQPMSLSVSNPDGGNDKQWFPDGTGQAGWLQARDDGKADAVRREVATIKKLAEMGFPVVQIIDRPPPQSITMDGNAKPVQATGGGVWLANVDKVATKKPKMLAHPFAGEGQARKLVTTLQGQGVDLHALSQNLQALLPRIDELCKHVGEVDIAFTRDGKITIMDVAPADGGQVAAHEDGGPQQIKAGLEKLLAKVNVAAAATGH